MSTWHRIIVMNEPFFTNLLVAWALKGFLIFAIGGAVALLLRRRTAAARHLVWTLAELGTVAVPFVSAVLPSWSMLLPVSGPVPAGDGGLILVPELPTAATDQRVAAAPTAAPLPIPSPAAPISIEPARREATALKTAPIRPGSLPNAFILLTWLWAAGVVVSGLPLLLGLWSLRRLARSSRPITAGPLHVLFLRIVAQLGLSPSAICLLESSRRLMPMTWGIWRPIILLPQEAQTWAEERLTMVVLHELAHVKRQDFVTQLLARLVCALHWFNPLAWLALARIRVEQERACDDLALSQGLDAPEYAGHLLAIVSATGRGRAVPAVASAMASASHVERRLRSILDPARNRGPLRRRHILLATLAAAFLLAPLATARVESAPPAQPLPQDKAQDAPRGEQIPKDQVQILEQVQRLYYKPPDKAKLVDGAIQGILDALYDPYAAYIRADELELLERGISASLVGIGAQLSQHDGRIIVDKPLPDSPAQRAGIRAGDEVVEIDGQPTKGLELKEVVKRITGRSGSVVKIKVVHADGGEAVLEITRAAIKIQTVLPYGLPAKGRSQWMIDADHQIGYAQVTQFASATPADLKDAIRAMQDQGMKGLILDLRSCPGGLLQAAVEVANLFLKGGSIVAIRGRAGSEVVTQADPEKALADFPLIVLINEQTASAAEIVSGALQARDRATLIGTRTVGKGSIQTLVKLDDGGGAIKLTTAFYTLPNGRKIDKTPGSADWGVDPSDDDFVPMDARRLEAMRQHRRTGGDGNIDSDDVQLTAALKAMVARVTTGRFASVGQPKSALIAYVNRLEEIRKRRDTLRKDLERVEKELDELNKAQTDTKP